MLRRVVALLAFALLAGCLSPATPSAEPGSDDLALPEETAPAAEPTGRTSRQGGDAPRESYELVADVGGLRTTNVTQIHWAMDGPLDEAAIEVQLDLGDENRCSVMVAWAGRSQVAGPSLLSIRELGEGYGWTSMSGGEIASVHAADIDTRTDGAGGGGSTVSRMEGSFSGLLRLTGIAHRFEGPSSYLPDEAPGAFSVECEKPVSVSDARRGTGILLLDANNLAGGVGGEVFVVGGANVQDGLAADLLATSVRATCSGFGSQYAEVALEFPQGSETWTFMPDYPVALDAGGLRFIEGGAGRYRFSVDRAGAYFEAFWCASWGRDVPLDLTPGLRAASVIDSPFDD